MNRDELNAYIAGKEPAIVNTYRPLYHMSPRVGWMNDPNGLIFFGGKYHLYYQANPLRTRPGQMTWGHFVSDDLVSYKDLGIALALPTLGENAYSGGAIQEKGDLHVFYTLHLEKHPQNVRYDGETLEGDEIYTEEENEFRKTLPREIEGKDVKEEIVYHSSSKDGSSFEKGHPVFDNDTLPPNLSQTDFRDPSPVKIGDSYYLFLGGKDLTLNQGVIIVLEGKDLDHFEYSFCIGPFYELGDMGECPSYRRIGDKDLLLICGSNTPRRGNDFRNINCSVFLLGEIDFKKKGMKVDLIKEIDKGDSFYAPQFIAGESRPVMVGWMEMWGKRYPTSRLRHGYVGAFTIPRIVSLKDGDIFQEPIPELLPYEKSYEGEGFPRQADITLTMKVGATLAIKGDNGRLIIGNAPRGVYLDSTESNSAYQTARWTNRPYEEAKLRILLDNSSIEIFVDGGRETITSRFYIDGPLRTAFTGEVLDIQIKEIEGRKA